MGKPKWRISRRHLLARKRHTAMEEFRESGRCSGKFGRPPAVHKRKIYTTRAARIERLIAPKISVYRCVQWCMATATIPDHTCQTSTDNSSQHRTSRCSIASTSVSHLRLSRTIQAAYERWTKYRRLKLTYPNLRHLLELKSSLA
jgi:hypothetical protein